jgi:CheY-like chemotaxis protein
MLAHELRNPLAPIRSGLEILALAEGGNHATITLMQEQVQQLVRLVEDLLDVSRIMEGRIELRREPMMLSTLIGRSVDAVHALAGERQLELVVTLPEQPVWVSADPVRLVQVFGNLLNNAIKYTDTGGRIELTAETRDGQAIVTVRDTGIGIEPELLPRIFDLFTQSPRSLDRAQGGLGIGLTLVRRLVELHDGWVAAHSEGRGRGSTFTLCLPVTQPATQDGKTAAAPRARTVRPRRVLVVDDNPGAAGLLAVLLTELGAQEVETAQDGPSALQKIREWHPEIVLLDIGIPGMDGYQVAKAVRDMPGLDDVTLIALTGYGRDEDRRRSREAGFDLHLVKPVTSEELEQVLTEPRRQAGKTERRSGNRAD